MNYVTHSLGGAAAGMIAITAGNVVDPVQQTTLMSGAVLGALFIDIDHKKSWMGNKVPLLSAIISLFCKHRGPIHTPVFIFIMAVILNTANLTVLQDYWSFTNPFIIGFVPGMLSHIVLDTMNVQGIMWLWPVSDKRISLLPITTNSIFEGMLCALLGFFIYGEISIF